MPFQLRVFMVDLMAFVMDGSTLWALLPDARKGGGTKKIPPHYPILLFDDAPGTPNAGDWTMVKGLLGLRKTKADTAWLLDQEDVEITFIGTAVPPTYAGAITKDLPDLTNRQSFDWVPRMAGISPTHKVIKPALIGGAFPNQLVARLKLPSALPGTFAFCKLLEGLDSTIYPATFPSSGSAFRRALADVVVARFAVTGTDVTIKTNKRKVTFTPPSDPCDILLGNMSPAPLAGNSDPHGYHFTLYYPLSTVAGGTAIPVLDNQVTGLVPGQVEKESEPKELNELDDEDERGSLSRPVCTFVSFEPK